MLLILIILAIFLAAKMFDKAAVYVIGALILLGIWDVFKWIFYNPFALTILIIFIVLLVIGFTEEWREDHANSDNIKTKSSHH